MHRGNPADIMGNLIEYGGEDPAITIFANYLDKTSREAFAIANKRNYGFYQGNIYPAICKNLRALANFYQVKGYSSEDLNNVPVKHLNVLVEFYKIEFASKLDKKEFVNYFASASVQAINNIAFWQLIISRLFILMGIVHENKALEQYVNENNLAVFKQFIDDINTLTSQFQFASKLVNYNQPDLGGDLSYVPFLCLNKPDLKDALQGADQSELWDQLNQYMNENYFYDKAGDIHGRSYREILIETFSEEAKKINNELGEYLRNELIKLYVEDKISSRRVMSQLKEIPYPDIQLLSSEDYIDCISGEEEDNWLGIIGSVYALSRMKGSSDRVGSMLRGEIENLPDELLEEVIKNIKISILIKSAKSNNIEEVDDLIKKLSNPKILDFIIYCINNHQAGHLFSYINKLHNLFDCWSDKELSDCSDLQANFFLLCLSEDAAADEAKLSYALRPQSLLWKVDIKLLSDLIYCDAILQRKFISYNLLYHLSVSSTAINRLQRIAPFAKAFNQASMRTKLHIEISFLDMILRLPSSLFNIVYSRLLLEIKGVNTENPQECADFSRKFHSLFEKEMGFVINYSVATLRDAAAVELTCYHSRFQKFFSQCNKNKISSLCSITIVKSALYNLFYSMIEFIQEILKNDSLIKYAEEDIEKVVRYLIEYVDNSNVIAFLNTKVRGSVESLMKNRNQLFVSHQNVIEEKKSEASLISTQIIKHDRDDSDDEFFLDEERPVKKQKR